MKISELMTRRVVSIHLDETADVAARVLSGHNIGALPVVDSRERLVGMVTDRDLVTRCMALGERPDRVEVGRLMTPGPVTAAEEEPAEAVVRRMGTAQVRRVPVVREGRVTGIVSLADLARAGADTAGALGLISGNVSSR